MKLRILSLVIFAVTGSNFAWAGSCDLQKLQANLQRAQSKMFNISNAQTGYKDKALYANGGGISASLAEALYAIEVCTNGHPQNEAKVIARSLVTGTGGYVDVGAIVQVIGEETVDGVARYKVRVLKNTYENFFSRSDEGSVGKISKENVEIL